MDKTKYKLDLHSHSIISHDGGITPQDYESLIANRIIDIIAITDHNETKLAVKMHEKLGEKIIVGEEITTSSGEIIGLYLNKTIPAGLTLNKAVRQIKEQGGLVYIPHPFETLRQGIQAEDIEQIKSEIDIIEIFNARALFRGKPKQAYEFATKHNLSMAASSDAHIKLGIGSAYSLISEMPERKSLVKLLKSATYQKNNAPLISLLFPIINKTKKKLLPEREYL